MLRQKSTQEQKQNAVGKGVDGTGSLSISSALLLGVIQGATEFLPVSSSAHLALAKHFFGGLSGAAEAAFDPGLTFSVFLHLATLAAVLIFCRETVFRLIPAFFSFSGKVLRGRIGKGKLSEYTPDERLILFLLTATLPLAAAIPLEGIVEAASSCARAVGALLTVNGLLLLCSDRIGEGNMTAANAPVGSALTVGLFQLAAIFPGLSRSGSTVTAGLLRGYDRDFAVEFSFLLSIPAVLGANVFRLPELFSTPVPRTALLPCAAGAAAAAAVGLLSMKLISLAAKRRGFLPFALYCLAVGTAALILG